MSEIEDLLCKIISSLQRIESALGTQMFDDKDMDALLREHRVGGTD